MPALYLIPSLISADGIDHLPAVIYGTLDRLDYFLVERLRTARRFIKALKPEYNLDSCHFIEMDKHDNLTHLNALKSWLEKGLDVGVISEAGCPCVADPGTGAVDLARTLGYDIIPLTGPSSIMLALMASGLNGQAFTFHGYLPIKGPALIDKIQKIGKSAERGNYTQIFIETPYRNDALLAQLMQHLSGQLKLCIARDLTGSAESILTLPLAKWSKDYFTEKVPAIFLIGK